MGAAEDQHLLVITTILGKKAGAPQEYLYIAVKKKGVEGLLRPHPTDIIVAIQATLQETNEGVILDLVPNHRLIVQDTIVSSNIASESRRMSLNDMMSPGIMNKGLQQQQQQPQSSTTSSAISRPTPPQTQQQQQQEASSSFTPIASLPTPPVTAMYPASFGDALSFSSGGHPPRGPSRRPRTDSSTLPPPPPKDPFPMPPPPPPPLPAVPPALSAGVASPTTVELTVEEKRAMWDERTRILSEAELAREQVADLEQQHVFALQIIQSRYFANLPKEDKIPLKDQLVELEKRRDGAKKTYEESVDKLFKTGSWPVAPPGSTEDGMEEEHKEVAKYIQELKDTASQMSKMLGDISLSKPPPLFLSADDDDDEDGAAMDIDQPDGGAARHKSLKRRRISENLDAPGGGSAPPMPTQEELAELLERLAYMEGLISTLQNDINEHGREAREECEQIVETKLDEFQAAREAEESQRVEEERQHMQSLEQDIMLTGEQVGELATEIGDLITRVGTLEVGVVASRKGKEEGFEKVLEVEQRLREYISTRQANVHLIQTFEKALNAYTSRPPSPPATPLNAIPSFDYILQSLEEPMVQALRSHITPAIEDLRNDVGNMVRTQNAELYSTLWDKISVTLKVLGMIQSKLNQGDTESAQILAGDVV
ncbi:hypothetical protein BYT27DRAFT_7341139 [Phlegmacium glaucopus]|nr:hypothetical protein BYT27DRAFT_7341139 [Phlegmacium glaucopus]